MSGTVIPTPIPAAANGNGVMPTINGEVVDPAEVSAGVEGLSASEALAWAVERVHAAARDGLIDEEVESAI